jgi:hypothetical protein
MPPDPGVAKGAVSAVVDRPMGSDGAHGWQVGRAAPPSPVDPVEARAARLAARLAVYAQYAAVVAEEAAAAVAGDAGRRTALRAVRDAAAEHFAELRGADADGTRTEAPTSVAFSDALTDALHELRHQEAVDDALARQLRALHETTAVRDLAPALSAGTRRARLDVRF